MTATEDKPHHHGDLRNALIKAAISILSEQGTAGLTLRKAAARAGVSHAAPTHHFGNLAGLLDAVAAEGFRQFRIDLEKGMARSGPTPRDRLQGLCMGYLRFAETQPALLDLMFRAERLEREDIALDQTSSASYDLLRQSVAPFAGNDPARARVVEAQVWSLIHGYAVLRAARRLATGPQDPSTDANAILALLDGLADAPPSQPPPRPLKGS